jgi:hypothetical protein
VYSSVSSSESVVRVRKQRRRNGRICSGKRGEIRKRAGRRIVIRREAE